MDVVNIVSFCYGFDITASFNFYNCFNKNTNGHAVSLSFRLLSRLI